jgi:hypothetical protein
MPSTTPPAPFVPSASVTAASVAVGMRVRMGVSMTMTVSVVTMASAVAVLVRVMVPAAPSSMPMGEMMTSSVLRALRVSIVPASISSTTSTTPASTAADGTCCKLWSTGESIDNLRPFVEPSLRMELLKLRCPLKSPLSTAKTSQSISSIPEHEKFLLQFVHTSAVEVNAFVREDNHPVLDLEILQN